MHLDCHLHFYIISQNKLVKRRRVLTKQVYAALWLNLWEYLSLQSGAYVGVYRRYFVGGEKSIEFSEQSCRSSTVNMPFVV